MYKVKQITYPHLEYPVYWVTDNNRHIKKFSGKGGKSKAYSYVGGKASSSNIIQLKKSDFQLVKQLNKERMNKEGKMGCSSLNLKKSFDRHVKDGLRYNKKTGITRNNSGILEQYSYSKDIPKNPTREFVIKWDFMRDIANSCSRIRRGYKP